MKAFILFLFSISILHTSTVSAAPKKSATSKKLTAAELKKVEQGKKIFAESKNAPPPSKHMQDKMQSSIPKR